MYPTGELKRLALAKATLQARIGVRRQLCALSGRRVAAAIDKVDQWRRRLQRWSGVLPLLAPLVLLRRRGASKVSLLFRWVPIVLRVYQSWRNFASAGAARRAAAEEFDPV